MAFADLFQFRKRPGWKRLGAVSFGWPIIPVFYTSANALIFVYFAWGKSWEALILSRPRRPWAIERRAVG